MYTNCDEIFKITIPAVRVVVAKSLSRKYKMNQSDIAKQLGVAQAAVSKYLSNRYSAKIAKIEKVIESKKLAQETIRIARSNHDKRIVSQSIDRLAASAPLVKEAFKII